MAQKTPDGIRFKGKLYTNWPDLRQALSAAGINPNEWVGDNQNKAQALGVGLASGGKVVKTNEEGVPLGEARAQGAADKEAREDFFSWIGTTLSAYGIDASEQMINRLAKAGVDIDDQNGLVTAFQLDPEVDDHFPGFSQLVDQGFVAVGPTGLGQYRGFKRQMNDVFERFEGRRMTDEEFLANVSGGVSTGLLTEFFEFRSQVNDAFERHQGRAATPVEIEDLFRTGKTAQRIEAEFTAQSFIQANQGDIQSTVGAFDFGQNAGILSDDELTALGQQQFGIESELGFDVVRRVEQARRRMQRIFQGAAATGPLALPQGATRGRPGSRVDVGA